MAKYIFGEIEGVKEGAKFSDRESLRQAWIHRAPVAGIDGNPRVGSSSIVLNGGYVDDYDLGNEILYTGHGGNDPGTKRQVKDQTWEATGNKALIISELKGLPVRVTRGFKHKSKFSPKMGYQYGGVYYVTEHFEDIGKDGFKICRYRLLKATILDSSAIGDELFLPKGTDETNRVKTTTFRIVRDTLLSKSIKELYDYTCQVCQIRISVLNVPYAEGAHIKPLGRPHNGFDNPENLLCLCPNHHVMLDKGVFAIDHNFKLIGLEGELNVRDNHNIAEQNLIYHKEHIYIND